MTTQQFTPIGIILKTKGFDGTLLVEFYHQWKKSPIKAVFVKNQSSEIPLLIDSFQLQKENTYLVHFLTLNTKEQAQIYNNKEIWMQEELAEKYFEIEFESDEMGFEVYNRDELLGIVVEIYRTAWQETLEIETESKTKILLPYVDELLNEIDPETKKIVFDLPEGYLESIPF